MRQHCRCRQHARTWRAHAHALCRPQSPYGCRALLLLAGQSKHPREKSICNAHTASVWACAPHTPMDVGVHTVFRPGVLHKNTQQARAVRHKLTSPQCCIPHNTSGLSANKEEPGEAGHTFWTLAPRNRHHTCLGAAGPTHSARRKRPPNTPEPPTRRTVTPEHHKTLRG